MHMKIHQKYGMLTSFNENLKKCYDLPFHMHMKTHQKYGMLTFFNENLKKCYDLPFN